MNPNDTLSRPLTLDELAQLAGHLNAKGHARLAGEVLMSGLSGALIELIAAAMGEEATR